MDSENNNITYSENIPENNILDNQESNENKKKNIESNENKKNNIEHVDLIINNFNKVSLKNTLLKSPQTIVNYKIILWWLPLLLYIIVMFIIIISFPNTTSSGFYPILLEFILSGCSWLILFIFYFIIDFIYQNKECNDTTAWDNTINSTKNASLIASFVAAGYFTGIFFTDKSSLALSAVPVPNSNISSQLNNLGLSSIGFIIGMLYINPINRDNCSLNIICKKNTKLI